MYYRYHVLSGYKLMSKPSTSAGIISKMTYIVPVIIVAIHDYEYFSSQIRSNSTIIAHIMLAFEGCQATSIATCSCTIASLSVAIPIHRLATYR